MLKLLHALVLVFAANAAFAQDSAIGNETPAADQASERWKGGGAGGLLTAALTCAAPRDRPS